MVIIGGYVLLSVQTITTEDSRVTTDRPLYRGKKSHRSDQTAGGRIFRVQGIIKDDENYMHRIGELRVRADNVPRVLDLEDGIIVENAKFGTLSFEWTVENGLDYFTYSAEFHETLE